MLVLHVAFAEGSLHLWYESAPEAKPKRARVVASYPYRTGAAELRTRLAPAGRPRAGRPFALSLSNRPARPASRIRPR